MNTIATMFIYSYVAAKYIHIFQLNEMHSEIEWIGMKCSRCSLLKEVLCFAVLDMIKVCAICGCLTGNPLYTNSQYCVDNLSHPFYYYRIMILQWIWRYVKALHSTHNQLIHVNEQCLDIDAPTKFWEKCSTFIRQSKQSDVDIFGKYDSIQRYLEIIAQLDIYYISGQANIQEMYNYSTKSTFLAHKSNVLNISLTQSTSAN